MLSIVTGKLIDLAFCSTLFDTLFISYTHFWFQERTFFVYVFYTFETFAYFTQTIIYQLMMFHQMQLVLFIT